MGCQASKHNAVTPDYAEVTKHYIEYSRRNSHCTQALSVNAEENSLTHRGKQNSLKAVVTDSSLEWGRLETIESEKIQVSKKVSPLAFNVKAKKYKSPFVLEVDASVYDTCTRSEPEVQPDSWYPKPRPTLRIEVRQ